MQGLFLASVRIDERKVLSAPFPERFSPKRKDAVMKARICSSPKVHIPESTVIAYDAQKSQRSAAQNSILF